MENVLEPECVITDEQRGRGDLERDLGGRVNVFCAEAGTNIGQTLGKAGSL